MSLTCSVPTSVYFWKELSPKTWCAAILVWAGANGILPFVGNEPECEADIRDCFGYHPEQHEGKLELTFLFFVLSTLIFLVLSSHSLLSLFLSFSLLIFFPLFPPLSPLLFSCLSWTLSPLSLPLLLLSSSPSLCRSVRQLPSKPSRWT